MKLTRLFSPQTALLLALAGSLLGVPLTAAAPLGGPAQDPPTLINHFRTEMSSKDALRQENALMDVISLANCTSTCTVPLQSKQNKQVRIENDTGSGSIVDLQALTPDLLKLYRRGPTDGLRLMALSALINVGNEKAIDTVVADASSTRYRQSSKVNGSTQKSLVGFYLARYPELRDLRGPTFSLEDVRQVKATRARAAKKAMKAAKSS